MAMLSIGLISPDKAFCDALAEQLKQADEPWSYAVFPSLEEAMAAWSERLPSLVFWDAQKAPASAEAVACFSGHLASSKPSPFLFVLGDAPESMEAASIAERFSRPLRLGYLMMRLQFYQRLLKRAADVSFPIGAWLFAPRARCLTAPQAEPIKLTDKESALLDYLCATETPVGRDELLAAIWGYDTAIDTHTLETHIYRLRRKLAPVADEVFLTEASGYRLNPALRGG